MSKVSRIGTAFAIVALMTGAAFAGPGAPGHGHAIFSAGEPGNPKKPSRVITITMSEGEGKMRFSPEKLVIKKDEQVRFVLKNIGLLDHEFLLATTKENIKHAEEMKKNPGMEHDDPNGIRLATNKTGEVIWRFTKTGEFEYGCLIPGHREAGMIGKIVVK